MVKFALTRKHTNWKREKEAILEKKIDNKDNFSQNLNMLIGQERFRSNCTSKFLTIHLNNQSVVNNNAF
jgi:hypothetical protein